MIMNQFGAGANFIILIICIIKSVCYADNKPYFENRPVPFRAVVPLNASAGYPIYKFIAACPDSSPPNLTLPKDEVKFKIEQNGLVKTTNFTYTDGTTYNLTVKANCSKEIETTSATLDIRGGPRPPQFFEDHYIFIVSDKSQKDEIIGRVAAKSFLLPNQSAEPIQYNKTTASDFFTIDANSGNVKLLKNLSIDNLKEMLQRPYKFNITAKQKSIGSDEAKLTLFVTSDTLTLKQILETKNKTTNSSTSKSSTMSTSTSTTHTTTNSSKTTTNYSTTTHSPATTTIHSSPPTTSINVTISPENEDSNPNENGPSTGRVIAFGVGIPIVLIALMGAAYWAIHKSVRVYRPLRSRRAVDELFMEEPSTFENRAFAEDGITE